MASPTPATAGELSPGPLRISDLEPTVSGLHTSKDPHMLPRRLDPISPTRKKRRTKKRRTKRAPQEEQGEEDSLGGELIGESALSQLRARLDPIYNSPAVPPLDLNSSCNTNDDTTQQRGNVEGRGREADVAEGGVVTAPQVLSGPAGGTITDSTDPHKSSKRKRTKRGRKRDEKEVEEPDRPPPGPLQEGEPHREEEIEGSHTQLREAPPDSSLRQGRQLPAFPSDTADPALDGTTPGPTLADQLAISAGHLQSSLPVAGEYGLPDDPQFLVSEEDVEEEVDGPITRLHTSLLTSSHPHTHPTTTSHSKEVVFVERKDGRGFVTQRHDAGGSAKGGQGDIEGATGRGEREVSSAEFALYTHKAIQTVMLSAHGVVAGISLWDCVVSSTLSWPPNRHLDLLQYYNRLTLPVHAVYVLLLSIVIVSLFDRFDFARPDRQCLESLVKAPSRIILFIVALLIFLALMVTLSVIAVDERIALYPFQPTLWSDVLTPINTSSSFQDIPSPTTHSVGVLVYIPAGNLVSSLLSPWLALAIVRAVCCCVSWLLVVWVRDYDRLQDYLSRMAGNTRCGNG